MFLNLIPFYGHYNQKQKKAGTSYKSLSGCQISSEVSFVIPHQANFDVLFQRGFWVIEKLHLMIYASSLII